MISSAPDPSARITASANTICAICRHANVLCRAMVHSGSKPMITVASKDSAQVQRAQPRIRQKASYACRSPHGATGVITVARAQRPDRSRATTFALPLLAADAFDHRLRIEAARRHAGGGLAIFFQWLDA